MNFHLLKKTSAAVLSACLAMQPAYGAIRCSLPHLWFSPESHFPPASNSDFASLFDPDASWKDAAAKLQGVKLSEQFFLNAPLPLLTSAVEFTRRQHIELGIEIQARCRGSDGKDDFRSATRVVERLKQVDAKVAYIAVDGSLFALLSEPGKGLCASDPAGAAVQAARIINVYKGSNENIRLEDIEPAPLLFMTENWSSKASSFYSALSNNGIHFEYLDADFDWRSKELTNGSIKTLDEAAVTRAEQTMRSLAFSNGMCFGVIVNGKSDADADDQWSDQALEHLKVLSEDGTPSRLILQSWHKHPIKLMPSTQVGTFTNTLLRASAIVQHSVR